MSAATQQRLPLPVQVGVVASILAAITMVAFLPALGCGFVNYDDTDYVTANPRVTSGISAENTRWAFTTFTNGNWHPLTWLSLQIDASLWWPGARGFHLTSVLLHVANVVLLFLALHTMTGSLWRSAAIALLFAVHPLRVESVAWISERKDVLSAFFGLLTLWSYGAYARRPKASVYVVILVTFALSLLCKPMLVTLPCLLLVLDWWPLGRVLTYRHWRWLVLEKVPLFVLVVVSAVFAFLAQAEHRAVASLAMFPAGIRFENAAVSYVTYIAKTLWPANLAVYYPHPIYSPGALQGIPIAPEAFGGSLAALSVLTGAAIAMRRQAPYLLAGWLWYLGTLVPVIGILQVGSQAYADRYTYIPQIGLLVALCWGIADLAGKYSRLAFAGGVAIGLALIPVTWHQLEVWHDSVTLWQNALNVTFSTATAQMNLGTALEERNELARARECFERAIAYEPNSLGAHIHMGKVSILLNRWQDAEQAYRFAFQLSPRLPEVAIGLGRVELHRGSFALAAALFGEALKRKPDDAEAFVGLSLCLLALGKGDQVTGRLQDAERTDPRAAAAIHQALGIEAETHGDRAAAARHFAQAGQLAPAQENLHGRGEWLPPAPQRPAPTKP